MFNKTVSYEVLTGQGGRWILDTTHAAKSNAMGRAQSLLDTNQHDAVRVTRLENDTDEQVILQKECAGKVEKPITISAIESSAVCAVADDFYGFEARKTAGRLLRQYLDHGGITAFELFHTHGHIRQLTRMEALYDQALHRIAAIQARALGEPPAARNDLLYALAAKVEARAREAADRSSVLALLNEQGLRVALAEIDKTVAPNQIAFFTGAVLADYLGQQRDWKQKLAHLIVLLEPQSDARTVTLVDQICAEIIDGAQARKDLFGPQPDLASALRIMIDLSEGRYAKGKDTETPLGRFNSVMRTYPMPCSREVLLERAARAISGTGPLTRENDDADKSAFLSLFMDLIGPGGFIGGVALSEAVTRRIRMVMRSGDDDLSPDGSIAQVLSMLPNQAVKVGYLLDLSQSAFGAKYQLGVLKPLLKIIETVSSLPDLLPPNSSPEEITKAVKDMRRRTDSGILSLEIGQLIDSKLRRLLDEQQPAAESPPSPPKKAAAPMPPAKAGLDRRTYNAGAIIFNEGDGGDEAFMIVSGEVEIAFKSGDRGIVLATLGRGHIIGELALIDNQPRMATARALEKTVLTVIPQETFRKRLDWLAGEDRFISRLLETFVDRLRNQAHNS